MPTLSPWDMCEGTIPPTYGGERGSTNCVEQTTRLHIFQAKDLLVLHLQNWHWAYHHYIHIKQNMSKHLSEVPQHFIKINPDFFKTKCCIYIYKKLYIYIYF